MNKTIFATVILIFCLISGCLFFTSSKTEQVFETNLKTIIIDAGHGLPDGGAVAIDGTVESDINLQIALLLSEKFKNAGIKTILVRTDQNGIYTEGNTIHAKKVSDIRNRVKIANENPEALVLSIHMNTFPDSNVNGAQVFYKGLNNNSKKIADDIQHIINDEFQSENHKKAKPIPSNVYLFRNIKNDSILVECGFLTNEKDLSKLKSYEFQDKFTTILTETIIYNLSGSDFNAS